MQINNTLNRYDKIGYTVGAITNRPNPAAFGLRATGRAIDNRPYNLHGIYIGGNQDGRAAMRRPYLYIRRFAMMKLVTVPMTPVMSAISAMPLPGVLPTRAVIQFGNPAAAGSKI